MKPTSLLYLSTPMRAATLLLFTAVALALSSCESGKNGNRQRSYSWINGDVPPAYELAKRGRFAEAQEVVARGEDTQAHFEQGVEYYNYWKKRGANPETGVESGDVWADVGRDRLEANEREMERMKAAAAQGDADAQAWLDQHESNIKLMRVWYDTSIRRDRPNYQNVE